MPSTITYAFTTKKMFKVRLNPDADLEKCLQLPHVNSESWWNYKVAQVKGRRKGKRRTRGASGLAGPASAAGWEDRGRMRLLVPLDAVWKGNCTADSALSQAVP